MSVPEAEQRPARSPWTIGRAPWQDRPLWAALFLLVIGSVYLGIFARPGWTTAIVTILHLLLGALVGIIAVRALRWLRKNRPAPPARAIGVHGFLALVFCCVGGVLLIVFGTFSGRAFVYWLHSVLGAIGVVLLAVAARRYGATMSSGRRKKGAFAVPVVVLFLIALGTGLVLVGGSSSEERESKMPQFFPSRAQTVGGRYIAAEEIANSRYCGECHSEIYDQWFSSQHHYGSFGNVFYRRAAEYTMERKGAIAFRFCAGCHDPALLFSGLIDQEIMDLDSPEAVEGISCVGCHAMRTTTAAGTGSYVIERPRQFPFANHPNPTVRQINKLLIRLKPEAHRRAFLKPFHREAEYCAACHKVTIEAAVNEFRWVRGYSEYDEWQRSGHSGQAGTTFYTADQGKRCQDCHMPKVAATDPPESRRGFIHDHRFLGSNTVIPLIENDAAQFEAVREFLTSNVLSVEIFAVGNGRRLRDRATLGDDAWMPVDRTEPILRADGKVWVDVVVRNRGVGHKFPAATLDLWDVWLEMLVTDGAGQTVFSSGHLLDQGEVDPTAHFFRNRPMDRHGNRTDKSNRFDTVTVLYDTGIPSGAAEVIHYQFDLPPGVKGPLTLRARLNHRKYTPYFARWVFGGRPAPGQEALVSSKVDDRDWIIDNVPLPRLPITTLAGDVQAIAVTGSEARLPLQAPPGPADALRFNDYGIGLLRQGELLGAEAAFRRVTTLDPSYADGHLNLARVFLRTARFEEAASMVAAALGCRPGYPKAIFFRAQVALIQGEYERALADFNAVLERYPRDRVVHDRAGRTHYLAGSFDKAIRHFKRILEIDTEERSAYYNLMLCYQAVGDKSNMEAAREKYEEFRPDFSIKQVTAEYRTRHKVESVEVEPLHVHPQ